MRGFVFTSCALLLRQKWAVAVGTLCLFNDFWRLTCEFPWRTRGFPSKMCPNGCGSGCGPTCGFELGLSGLAAGAVLAGPGAALAAELRLGKGRISRLGDSHDKGKRVTVLRFFRFFREKNPKRACPNSAGSTIMACFRRLLLPSKHTTPQTHLPKWYGPKVPSSQGRHSELAWGQSDSTHEGSRGICYFRLANSWGS